MQWSEIIVIALGTLLFFGFAVWMGFYSRRRAAAETSSAETTMPKKQTARGLEAG